MTTNDYPETVKKLRTEYDFLRYLQLLKEIIHNYVIFITVCDTGAAPYYTPEHAAAMAELGLKINMLQRYRQPYIAVIDHGKVIREICSEKLDEPLTLEGKINNHDIWIYSAGFNYQVGIGTGAYVCIDGANFLRGCRGFNFLVFDVEKDEIIDTRGFDTFDLAKCKNSSTSDQINIMKNKRQIIDKVMDIYKTNILNYDFISDKKSKENYSILNMLLSLMDIKLLYENILLNDAFLMGVDLLYQTNFPKYLSLKGKDKIIKYTNDLLSQQKKLEMEKHKYENIEKYFILHQKFAGIKNLDEFLKYIIMENIKDNQKINKIKKVLNFEKVIKGNEKDNDNGIDSSKIIKNILKRNKNKSFDYDKLSFYTTDYYNNKFRHYKYNRNNKFLKYSKNTGKLKNNVLKIGIKEIVNKLILPCVSLFKYLL